MGGLEDLGKEKESSPKVSALDNPTTSWPSLSHLSDRMDKFDDPPKFSALDTSRRPLTPLSTRMDKLKDPPKFSLDSPTKSRTPYPSRMDKFDVAPTKLSASDTL